LRQLDLTNKEFINEQKLNDFIVWIMHDASCARDQLEVQRPQLVLSKLTGCNFQTFSYSIQRKISKIINLLEKVLSTKPPIILTK
jgi:hypothetical protein